MRLGLYSTRWEEAPKATVCVHRLACLYPTWAAHHLTWYFDALPWAWESTITFGLRRVCQLQRSGFRIIFSCWFLRTESIVQWHWLCPFVVQFLQTKAAPGTNISANSCTIADQPRELGIQIFVFLSSRTPCTVQP